MVALGGFTCHRQRVRIFKAKFTEVFDAILFFQPVRHFPQHSLAIRYCISLHRVCPDRSRVIDVAVDLSFGQRLKENDGTHPLAAIGLHAALFQTLADEICEYVLLGKSLSSNYYLLAAGLGQLVQRCGTDTQRKENYEATRGRKG